jgi:hypothetical protein
MLFLLHFSLLQFSIGARACLTSQLSITVSPEVERPSSGEDKILSQLFMKFVTSF